MIGVHILFAGFFALVYLMMENRLSSLLPNALNTPNLTFDSSRSPAVPVTLRLLLTAILGICAIEERPRDRRIPKILLPLVSDSLQAADIANHSAKHAVKLASCDPKIHYFAVLLKTS